MIKVENLKFSYRRGGPEILRGVNFSARPGEIIAIVGKNGSGKSTLARILAGAAEPTGGSVKVDGLIAAKENRARIFEKVGVVFQNPENQIIFNSIREELQFSLPAAEVEKRLPEALKIVGMEEKNDADLYELSLGQKQRMVLAEVLARRPKYIVLDEPTTMLDGRGKEKIYAAIRWMASEKRAIICFTNLADEILLADRTLILENGRIAAEVLKKDLLKTEEFRRHGIFEPLMLRLAREVGVEEMTEWTVAEFREKVKNAGR